MSADFTPVDPGPIRVEVRYRDPSYEDETGTLFFPPEDEDWREGPDWIADPADCAHSETMCRGCLETWNIDHKIRMTFDEHDGVVVDVDEMLRLLEEQNIDPWGNNDG